MWAERNVTSAGSWTKYPFNPHKQRIALEWFLLEESKMIIVTINDQQLELILCPRPTHDDDKIMTQNRKSRTNGFDGMNRIRNGSENNKFSPQTKTSNDLPVEFSTRKKYKIKQTTHTHTHMTQTQTVTQIIADRKAIVILATFRSDSGGDGDDRRWPGVCCSKRMGYARCASIKTNTNSH